MFPYTRKIANTLLYFSQTLIAYCYSILRELYSFKIVWCECLSSDMRCGVSSGFENVYRRASFIYHARRRGLSSGLALRSSLAVCTNSCIYGRRLSTDNRYGPVKKRLVPPPLSNATKCRSRYTSGNDNRPRI